MTNTTTHKEKSVQKSVLTPKERQLAGLTPIKKGQVLNPKGRGKGVKDVKTIIREAMMKIGKTQNMTAEEIEELMHQAGIKQAIKGSHQFYASISDRLYGPVDKSKAVTVNVNTEVPKEVTELTKKLNDIYRTK